MKLSKNSAIYKFMDESIALSDKPVPANLCPFVRRFILGVLFSAFLATLLVYGLISDVFALVSLYYWYFEPNWVLSYTYAFLQVLVGVVLLFMWALSKVPADNALWRGATTVANSSTVQLGVRWYRAAHDKVCPDMEFTQ